MITRSLSLLIVPLLGVSLTAQLTVVPPPTRGMMPSFPVGLVFDDNLSQIARKRPGTPAVIDSFAGTGGVNIPEYTVANIMQCLKLQAGGLTLAPIEIDAMSTGNDRLPLLYYQTGTSPAEFRVSAGNTGGWATLYLSRTVPGQDVGADIVGYYFENAGFPQQLRQAIYTEILRTDFSPALAATTNIAAMDFAMGQIVANRGQRDPGVIETLDKLYFSLTPASAASPNLAQAVNATGPIDGATIFVATFNLQNGKVSQVGVHATRANLLLPAAPQTIDIDALGMYFVPSYVPPPSGLGLKGGTFCYIISANDGQMPDELMVVATPWDPVNSYSAPSNVQVRLPLRAATGQILIGNDGLLPGRVKGLCSQDPDFPFGCMTFGVPILDFLSPQPRMGLSLTAEDFNPQSTVSDKFRLTGVLSGWVGSTATSEVQLSIEHPAGTFTFISLPNRGADQTQYQFSIDRDYTWQQGNINDYKFVVITTPAPATPSSTWVGSISSTLRRRANP